MAVRERPPWVLIRRWCGCTRYVITKSGGFGHEKLLLDLADRIAAEQT